MRRNKGFTLLEMVFSLWLLWLLLWTVLPVLHYTTNYLRSKDGVTVTTLMVAQRQINQDVHSATSYEISGNTLYLYNKDIEVVLYKVGGYGLVRQRNGAGTEYVLYGIKNIRFIKEDEVTFTIRFDDYRYSKNTFNFYLYRESGSS
ncbi:MAG: competence type IV pilus minor pilin ComGF [Bacilli bacterium]